MTCCAACILDIRSVEAKLQRPIGILADLQGPKIRIGTFAEKEARINAGDTFIFDTDKTPGNATRVYLPHPEIFAGAKEGDNLLLNDGRLRVEIITAESDRLTTRVIFGGTLSDRKGVNLPDTVIPIPALTAKDRSDLEAAAEAGVDWIALSFVQRPDDVAEARKLIAGRAGVMAKIEKPAALHCLDEILEIADGLMVARGDLGVELPLETVPGKQKQITRAARTRGQAGDRRHADAGIDDRRAGADPRRSLRRRHRRLRRRRCHHAVGGKRHRQHGRTRPWRPWTGSRASGARQPLSRHHHRPAQRAAGDKC